ncbi:MAG: hypothetical protein A4S09_17190 [Proteobacteria bacterium SG_bin7]|nr:MAG: hypothetical protein A4S09_17190 [Proteobacteria bacterium SG_bin7]
MKNVSPIILLFLLFPILGFSKTISKIIGSAGDHFVTTREVEINSLIEGALYSGKTFEKAKPDGPKFLSDVNAVLLELIVSLEAEQFSVTNVSAEALASARQKVERGLKGRADWKSLNVSSYEIQNQIKRKLLAKQFIRFKVESSYVTVTDLEAEEFFRKNSKMFQGADLKTKKDEIKASLSRQRVDQRLQEWFGVLHKKYAVRNFVTPS